MLLERARIWDAVIRAGAVRWSSTSVYSEAVPAYLVTDTGRSKVVEGVTFPSSRAAVIVTILKVDPGSKVSVTGRLRSRSGLIWWRWLGLNRGTVAIARIAPSLGRITMAIALRAPNLARVSESVRSTSFWIRESIARRTSLPGTGSRSLSTWIGRPKRSRTSTRRPATPRQLRVELLLHPRQALVLVAGEPQHLGGLGSARKEALVGVREVDARDAELAGPVGRGGRHVAREHRVDAPLGQGVGQRVGVALQDRGEPGRHAHRVGHQVGRGGHVDRQPVDGQVGAVAALDGAALGRQHVGEAAVLGAALREVAGPHGAEEGRAQPQQPQQQHRAGRQHPDPLRPSSRGRRPAPAGPGGRPRA